jgi:di/tricarboxylate transporter
MILFAVPVSRESGEFSLAIVFSFERMKLADMVRAGFLLSIVAVAATFGVFALIGRAVFGLRF